MHNEAIELLIACMCLYARMCAYVCAMHVCTASLQAQQYYTCCGIVKMDSIQCQYMRINHFLMCFIGQWPYQKNWKKMLIQTVFAPLVFAQAVIQVNPRLHPVLSNNSRNIKCNLTLEIGVATGSFSTHAEKNCYCYTFVYSMSREKMYVTLNYTDMALKVAVVMCLYT